MEKVYAPHDIERRIYERWESHDWFAPSGRGAPYCIVIPPPNVTGTLHMGHAFQYTLMDALTRYHRMRGDDTLWQPGTDHAGIATQMVVERQIEAHGRRRADMTREQFVGEVWRWKERSGGTIVEQMRRLGVSVDWSRERFTMDDGLSRAVTEVFVELYEAGLIYRGKRLVNWDPVLLTALSDLEVENVEEDGHLWNLRYPLEDGSGHIVVATTRPETMLGDSAVAVNPRDTRFEHLVGRALRLPLAERLIPIIADDHVDPEFGSGCVKVTPAHDFNDYEIGLRHDLPQINIFTARATLNEHVPERFRGLDRYEARKRIVAELEKAGLLEKIEPHRLTVPRGDRSGAVLEPYLTDQWYVKIAPLAAPAVAAVEQGRTRFVPQGWSRTYFEWMRNIRDWCVSRQLWWGHRIPAWYDAQGNVYVGRSEDEVRASHKLAPEVPLRRDDDVLDTWFSAALWPLSTLGWPQRTAELAKFYPTSVLVTGFDIIFFWVARMLMMGLKFMGEVPFRDVYIHGLIRDEHGEKMSKSKGNVIDPLDVVDGTDLESLVAKRTSGLMQPQRAPAIERATRKRYPQGIAPYGTDALRFTFTALASPSRDLRFDLERVAGYRNFCNKLWNAARFVALALGDDSTLPVASTDDEPTVADRWIRSRFGRAVGAVEGALAEYRFDYAASALYEFTWYEWCDWYLELAKALLHSGSPRSQRATQRTLVEVLEALQRALHPFIPFITEEIWRWAAPLAGRSGPTVMLAPYPRLQDFPHDEAAEHEIDWLKAIVLAVRQIRGEMNINPSRRIPILLQGATPADQVLLERHRVAIERLAGAESLTVLAPETPPPKAAVQLVGELAVLVPMAGLIDAAAETARLEKLLAKAAQDLGKSREKLASEHFVHNAPTAIVENERRRESELAHTVTGLEAQLSRVRELFS